MDDTVNIEKNDEINSLGYIRLSFGPKWKYVACVRSFVQNFLSISISDSQKADKISMAVSELVENAVKYNAKEKTWLYIQLLSDDADKILVESENYATPDNVKTLQKHLDRIYEKSPMDAYIERMKEAVSKDGTSQLGLARIRCEANCDLKIESKPNGILKVRAVFH
jgi:hypothetical protein